jgi:hypothetical protein
MNYAKNHERYHRMHTFHFHAGVIGLELGDSLKDVLNTGFWPAVVLVAARLHRSRKCAVAGSAA